MMSSPLMRGPMALPVVFISGALSCLLLVRVWDQPGSLQLEPVSQSLGPQEHHARELLQQSPHVDQLESVSEKLSRQIRVLCLVVTHPGHHLTQASHVRATWARRCSRVLFLTNAQPQLDDPERVLRTCGILAVVDQMGDELLQFENAYCTHRRDEAANTDTDSDASESVDQDIRDTESSTTTAAESDGSFLPTVSSIGMNQDAPDITTYSEWIKWFNPPFPFLEVKDTAANRDGLWNKTMQGFQHVHDHFLNDFDWFLKADDDTYVIMENLRNLLQYHDADSPLYFGCNFRYSFDVDLLPQGYMSGGGGYVLSREALRRFVAEVHDHPIQTSYTEAEDYMMGRVLTAAGVVAGDSRDSAGRLRFFPLSASAMASPERSDTPDWYWQLTEYSHDSGPSCCSPSTISFHYMTPSDMYLMEMLLYHIRPHGLVI